MDKRLSICQQNVLTNVSHKHNIFITGPAGTGKSFLLNYIIDILKLKFTPSKVGVTAPTGIAAANVNGTTLHSWCGIGIGDSTLENLVKRIRCNKPAFTRLKTAKVLIIDEISMLDGKLFDMIDNILKVIRSNTQSFGGIQVILCGDFYQLPPVNVDESGFAFESNVWSEAKITTYALTEIIRQKGDTEFMNVLNQIRIGTFTEEMQSIFENCHVSVKPLPPTGIVPTKLYCLNRDVDRENMIRLESLDSDLKKFTSHDSFSAQTPSNLERMISDALNKKVARDLHLKVGAQVMLTKNMPDKNLVNGSRGIVINFDEVGKPVVRFMTGAILTLDPVETTQKYMQHECTRRQYPLKLAWALTIHKSQGSSLDCVEVQVSGAFAAGQTYVALSRCTSLAGLWISGNKVVKKHIFANEKVINFYCV